MIRRLIFTLLTLMIPAAAQASTVLDVESMLARPGVRLVVVEFYATWCKPCMDAIPRWDALHKKYYDEGLRLIVVNTQDPNGLCGSPGWTPDDMVCDIDGSLAKRMGALELPAAYLWSWQGNLLAQRGHVDKVEEAVERFFRENPRVLVESPVKGKAGDYLVNLARETLTREGKFMVVASDAEAKLAAKIRKKSYQASKREDTQCKLGQELAANSLLQVNLINKRLTMQLFSAESGCLLQGAGVRYNWKKPEQSMAEVTEKLLSQLKSPQLVLPKMLSAPAAAADTQRKGPSMTETLAELDRDVTTTETAPAMRAPRGATSVAPQISQSLEMGSSSNDVWFWSSAALSSVALGTGIYFYALGYDSANQAAALQPGSLDAALDSDRYASLSYGFLGAGAAVGLGALYFYLQEPQPPEQSKSPQKTDTSSVTLSGVDASILGDGLFVMFRGGF